VGEIVSFQETLRRLAMIDETLVEGQARLLLGLGLAGTPILDPKTAALLQLGASVASGTTGMSLEWSTARALARARPARRSPTRC
jgi:hypothetical protein